MSRWLVEALVALGVLWPAAHMALAKSRDFSPWRLGGYGMYTTPLVGANWSAELILDEQPAADASCELRVEGGAIPGIVRDFRMPRIVGGYVGELRAAARRCGLAAERGRFVLSERRLDLANGRTIEAKRVFAFAGDALVRVE